MTNDNLWYIYDYESALCDECTELAICAIWHNVAKEQFIAVCGKCDEDWKDGQGALTNA